MVTTAENNLAASDIKYMARAIQLAQRGLYTTDPNPRVGCVLVKDDQIIGQGWHERAGEAHAEINALKSAGDQARGSTAYVTLEPCCHHGKTPPCSDALIKAGISRVVVAMQDPNPSVAGQGIQQLKDAGIAVSTGILESDAEALNPGFIMRMRNGRPYVRCKLAMSLDGRTAMSSGESKWITSAQARQDVHRIRARSSAIVTGIGTVLADDPSLNVRLPDTEALEDYIHPVRVILDPHLSMSADAKMFSLPGRTIIFSATRDEEQEQALQQAGAEIIYQQDENGFIDLPEMLRCLAGEQVNEVLLETGATLSGAMLKAGLIDELKVYMAPHLMGNNARGLFNLPGFERMDQRIELDISDIRAVGKDWCITAKVKKQA
jgi:diaminohydroxyphosphoribosylaminopyrimidine deaminase/5-amino-6-(5-phosphoribosylamino)uracil reductase